MSRLKIFWDFSRPHTLIGTLVSISALWVMASQQFINWPFSFYLALLSAVCCNVFITGYNQMVDVPLDKINKPDLPLPSNKLSMKAAATIVLSSLFISLGAALIHSLFLFGLVLLIAIIGFLYSWKKVYLKRQHTLAAVAITLVRGFLINVGFYLLFLNVGPDISKLPLEIWLLVIFVFLFSLGISWFKDIPDMMGDVGVNVKSLAIRMGAANTFRAGLVAVATGYTVCAFAPIFFHLPNIDNGIMIIGNGMLGFAFLYFASRVDPTDRGSISKFYMVFWALFAAEYVLFALGFVGF